MEPCNDIFIGLTRAALPPPHEDIPVTLTREQWEGIMEALSDLSNEKLRESGSFLDSGDDAEALDAHKASRRFHTLHKALHTAIYGNDIPIL